MADQHRVFDSSGRLVYSKTQEGAEFWQWDGEGQLHRICTRKADVANVCKQVLIDTTSRSRVVGEATANVASIFVHGPEGIATAKMGNTVSFPVGNIQGSLVGEANANGELSLRRSFDAFGNARTTIGNATTPFGYNGELQTQGQLVFLRARHYAPDLGRFLQRDSFEGRTTRLASLNRYAYAEGDPIGRKDPGGFESERAIMGAEAMLGATDAYLNGLINLPAVVWNVLSFGVAPINRSLGQYSTYAPYKQYVGEARDFYSTRIPLVQDVPDVEQSPGYRFGETAFGVYSIGRTAASGGRALATRRAQLGNLWSGPRQRGYQFFRPGHPRIEASGLPPVELANAKPPAAIARIGNSQAGVVGKDAFGNPLTRADLQGNPRQIQRALEHKRLKELRQAGGSNGEKLVKGIPDESSGVQPLAPQLESPEAKADLPDWLREILDDY